MKGSFLADYIRITGENKISFWGFIKNFIKLHQVRYLYFFRNKSTKISKILLKRFKLKYGLEIYSNEIGPGLYIGHAFNITINEQATLGKNCNIHKGVTIGQENRGIRKGAPTIGNQVWIGVNSTIVGNIKIGDNVLIAPNSYVNCDVPSNSIVFGNPCIIKHKDNATESYIKNIL